MHTVVAKVERNRSIVIQKGLFFFCRILSTHRCEKFILRQSKNKDEFMKKKDNKKEMDNELRIQITLSIKGKRVFLEAIRKLEKIHLDLLDESDLGLSNI